MKIGTANRLLYDKLKVCFKAHLVRIEYHPARAGNQPWVFHPHSKNIYMADGTDDAITVYSSASFTLILFKPDGLYCHFKSSQDLNNVDLIIDYTDVDLFGKLVSWLSERYILHLVAGEIFEPIPGLESMFFCWDYNHDGCIIVGTRTNKTVVMSIEGDYIQLVLDRIKTNYYPTNKLYIPMADPEFITKIRNTLYDIFSGASV